MKFICLGYLDETKWESLSESEQKALMDECFAYDDVLRKGGHFAGGTMLHWAKGAEGKGVVCAADIATVNLDRKTLSFMRSYPNFIPLSAKGAQAIAAALEPFAFDRIYAHFFDRMIMTGAKAALRASVERHVAAVGGAYDRG